MNSLCRNGHDTSIDHSKYADGSCRACKKLRDQRYRLKKSRKRKRIVYLVLQKKLKVLDFDIENRPLSYWIPTEPTSEITAIASCWTDDPDSMEVMLLGRDSLEDILLSFVKRYNQADIVTGHYIRKHDLPTINGALMELGLPHLKSKLSSDTRLDMIKKKGVPATQEYLGEIFGLQVDKFKMGQVAWRQANRLVEEGLELTAERVTTDVRQHILLRKEMIKRNLLSSPKMWSPK